MKTISISFLLLVAFPFHLVAQESQHTHHHAKTAPKYFTYKQAIDSTPNHIVAPTNQSNRKTASTNVTLQNYQLPTQPNPLKVVENVSPNSSRFTFQTQPAPRVAKLQVEEIILESGSQQPSVSDRELVIPDNVIRPTPGNTAPTSPRVIESPQVDLLPPPEPVAEAQPEPRYEENFRTDTPAEPERVSLDELRMLQRQQNSFPQRPSTMRDVVDHFSPGGEPFAIRGYAGNPTFFGVDRRQCCDEWENFSNCGGLKAKPGHLGIPCLRSKDDCDTVTPCRLCTRKSDRGCGCAACKR